MQRSSIFFFVKKFIFWDILSRMEINGQMNKVTGNDAGYPHEAISHTDKLDHLLCST